MRTRPDTDALLVVLALKSSRDYSLSAACHGSARRDSQLTVSSPALGAGESLSTVFIHSAFGSFSGAHHAQP